MDVAIDDKELAMEVLNVLFNCFENCNVALDAMDSEDETFSYGLVKSRLLQEGQRFKMRDPFS